MLDALIDKLKLRKLKRNKDREYANYLNRQFLRSRSKLKSRSAMAEKRKGYLVDILSSTIDLQKISDALVLGCRDSAELNLLEKQGVKDVTGIDLFSADDRILVMDMHQLEFVDDMFELVYSSHSLEHAFDYGGAMDEIARVLKPGGYLVIEVPVNFVVRGADLNNFQDCEYLLAQLSLHMRLETVLHKKYVLADDINNFCGTDAVRLIVQVA